MFRRLAPSNGPGSMHMSASIGQAQPSDSPTMSPCKSDFFPERRRANDVRNSMEAEQAELALLVLRKSRVYARALMDSKEQAEPTVHEEPFSRQSSKEIFSKEISSKDGVPNRNESQSEDLKAARREADELRQLLVKQREDFEQQLAELEQERDNALQAMMEEGRELQSRIAALVKEKEAWGTRSDSGRTGSYQFTARRDAKPAGTPDDGSTACGGSGGTPCCGTPCCGTPRSASSSRLGESHVHAADVSNKHGSEEVARVLSETEKIPQELLDKPCWEYQADIKDLDVLRSRLRCRDLENKLLRRQLKSLERTMVSAQRN